MSSAMVHIQCAKKYDASAPTLFYTGNIAPDLLGTREAKDKTHFRGVSDRFDALMRFAQTLDLHDPFQKGILMHLFLDLHWDREGYDKYKTAHEHEQGWFVRYRREIFLASAYLYHHTDYAKELFFEMNRTFLPIGASAPCGITRGELQRFVSGTWYLLLNATEAYSQAFPPSMVENFTDFVCAEYKKTFG